MKQQMRWALLSLLIPTASLGNFFACDNSQLNVGALFNFARYKQGELPNIQGYLAGIHADYIYGRPHVAPLSNLYSYLRFDGRWNAGFVCGCDDLKLQIKDYRPEWAVGYNFCLKSDQQYVTPLVGVGFYYLSDEIKRDVVTFRYFNVYIPVGASFLWRRCDDFQVELSAVYRANAHTRLKIEDPCLDLCDKLRLCKTRGAHVELPFTWFLNTCRCWDIQTKVVPFFDWNHFGRATETTSLGVCFPVPKLDRWYLGLHVDVGIHF